MTDLDQQRRAFLMEPDDDHNEETAGDVLARKLSALTTAPPADSTFGAKVGIGAALVDMPLLEAIDKPQSTGVFGTKAAMPLLEPAGRSGRQNFGTFENKKAPVRDVPFGGHNDEAALDHIADLAHRLEKSNQKRILVPATAEEKAKQKQLLDLIASSEKATKKEENFGGLSDAAMLSVREKAQENAAARDLEERERQMALYGGITDIFTKKGRNKMKLKKDTVNKAVHDAKSKLIEDRLKEKEAKKQAKEEAKQKGFKSTERNPFDSLDKKSTTMNPSERISYESLREEKGDLPTLVPIETFAKKQEQRKQESFATKSEQRSREHANVDDERALRKREQRNKVERYMMSLMPPEQALVEHMNEIVRHSPSVGLQAVEASFKQLPARSTEMNYFGALAFASALAKIRDDIEKGGPLKSEALKKAADSFHAQSTTPMDAAKATLFAEALDQYGVYVRKSATALSTDNHLQEEAAMHLGENLADVLIASAPSSPDASWNASHPKIALAAVTDRLFQSVLKSAVNDGTFVSTRVNSFWKAEMPSGQWKAVAQKHFV